MAENPIRKDEIIDVAGLAQSLKEIISLLQVELVGAMDAVTKQAKELKTSLSAVNATTADGQQAIRTITEQTNTLNSEYIKASVAVKELERAEKARLKIEQEEIKYGKILPGSYKDITSKLKQLREETLRLTEVQARKNIPQIKAYEDRLKKLDAEMGRHNRNVGNYKTTLKGLGVQLLSLTGATAGVAGAIKLFKGIIDSTETSALAFESVMKGAGDAVSSMFKSIASGDLRGFFSNMKEAFTAGKEFALAMDEAEDKTRAFKIAEADALKQTVDLTKVARDATKTNRERIAAIDEIITIEESLASRRAELARTELQLQLTRTAKLNKVSKDELLAYIKRDEVLMKNVEAGQKFIDVLKDLDQSTKSSVLAAVSLGNVMLPDKLYIPKAVRDSWKQQIDAMSAVDRVNMQLAANLGNVTDKEADAITSLYTEVKSAEIAAEENTMRIFSRRQALIEQLIKEDKKVVEEGNKEGTDRTQKYWDDQLSIAEKATADNTAVTAKRYEEEYKLQLAQVERSVATEEEKQAKLREINEQNRDWRVKNAATEALSILSIVSDSISSISDIYESSKQRELSAAGDNAKKREDIERKYFNKQKSLSIMEALVNGAVAITRQFADLPFYAALVTSALVGASTAAQVAAISAQKFAEGGFTGKGGRRDETGERIAGIVHEDEFVINKKQTKKYRPLLDAIHRDDQLAIASSLNNTNLVWDKTAQMINQQDPFTEKMYHLMKETPVSYIDSRGNTVLKYADGRKRIIKRSFNVQPSMIR